MNSRPAFSLFRGAIATAAVAVHDAYEGSPLAVHKIADELTHRHFERADTAAMTDPVYAEIEARRDPAPGTPLSRLNAKYILFGAEDGIQKSIRDRLAPDPLWLPLVRRLSARPVRQLTRGGMYAYQRAVRGWSDDDTWNLGTRLCTTLAAQLNHYADTAWGWPSGEFSAGGSDYAALEDWTAALRQAATGLERWATHWNSPAALAVVKAVDEPDDVFDSVAELRAIDDAARLAAAQEALRWVAENLKDLWD